jgi:uncharacterized membrane protein YtjA (UPF0391 family)
MFALQFLRSAPPMTAKISPEGTGAVGLLIRSGARFVLLPSAGRTRAGGAAMQELKMLYYALVFLIVGVIAGALGVAGVASVASQIAWVLFVIGIVLLLISLITGRRTVV